MNSQKSTTMKIKSVNSNMDILNNTNPEIFDTSPRPGGFLKVMVPTRSQDYMAVNEGCQCPTDKSFPAKKSAMSISSSRYDGSSKAGHLDIRTANTTSREFRLKRAIEETDWELTAVDETDTVVGISTVLQDTINMLAVTISCVMMMAAGLPVPEDYLNWAQRYLECIKDDEGINPPNVQGLISEIIKRKDNPDYKPDKGDTGTKKGSSSGKLDKSGKSSSTKAHKSKSGTSSSRVREEDHEEHYDNTLEAEKPSKNDSALL